MSERCTNWRRAGATLALAASLLASAAAAREAAPLADDPALEARVLAIAQDLRCLVCQNETIAASSAGLAVDLRNQIRQRLQTGESAAQIRDFMVQRYGRFVLYRPPLEPQTWALWLGPFVLLGGGLAALVFALRRRRAASDATQTALTPKQRRQIEAALHEAGEARP